MRLLALIALLLASPAWAADYFIDPGCTNDGDGASATCGTGAGFADKDVPAFVDGTDYKFRGFHASHSNCTSGFNGRYYVPDRYLLNGIDNSTFKSYNWTAAGTGEQVLLTTAKAPESGWTVCTWDSGASQCDCGPGNQNLTTLGDGGQTACVETWWALGCTNATCTGAGAPCACCSGAGAGTCAGNTALVLSAIKPDGSSTYRVASLGAMDNSTANYISAHCTNSVNSTATFIPCFTSSDCPSGETCTATSAEVDSFTDATPAPDEIMVRWGAAGDSNCSDQRCNPTTSGFNSYVIYTDNGYGFQVQTASTNVTVAGFWFLGGRRAAIALDGTTDSDTHDWTIDDVHVMWRQDDQGSDYCAAFYGVSAITFQNSECAFNGSELHTEGKQSSVATVLTIQNNWFHDIGENNAVGTISGTPMATIFGELGGGPGTGNYTGSVFNGNLIQRIKDGGSPNSAGIGVILENDSDGWAIHDNVFDTMDGACIKMDSTGSNADSSVNNTDIFNNIFHDCGNNPGGGKGVGIHMECTDSNNELRDNEIYNNTFVDIAAAAIHMECTVNAATYCSGNLVRNNIISSSESQKCAEWDTTLTDSTNIFNYNLCSTAAATAAKWAVGGSVVSKACSALTDIGANNINNCPSAVFQSSSNFHIGSTSPAKDAGTTRCCSSTADINNTVADDHGFASYADGQANVGSVDIGADEYAGRRRVLVVTSP